MRGTFLVAISFGLVSISYAQGAGGRVFHERPGYVEFTGTMIVRPLQMAAAIEKTGSGQAALALRSRARQRVLGDALRYYPEVDEYIARVPSGTDENGYAARMLATGDYEYVEPNWRVYPVIIPNDPRYNLQWHHPRIRSPQGWDIITGRATQIIAYTDTGIDINHPDLAANRVPGYNAVDNRTEQQGGQVNDINGHGTHVAGIGSAIGNNGVGVTGVGWNFRIMMIRVSNSPGGGSTIEWLTRGARWAVDNGAKTVSASYSGVSNAAIQTTGAYIKSRGGLYLYAADNNGSFLVIDHPDVIVVGASDQSDMRATFSNFGLGVDVFAPGVGIYSTLPNGYGSLSGTSMATPMANGVTAMIWARNPGWTPTQVEQKLFQSCADLGAPGDDPVFGWGRVDLLNSVSGGASAATVTPSSFTFFRGALVSGTLPSLHNADDDRLVSRPGVVLSQAERPIQLIIEGTAPAATASLIEVVVEAHCSITNISQRVEEFNFTSNSYTQLDERNMPTADLRLQLFAPGNTNEYIGPSNVLRARISYKEAGPIFSYPWLARVDEATWRVTP